MKHLKIYWNHIFFLNFIIFVWITDWDINSNSFKDSNSWLIQSVTQNRPKGTKTLRTLMIHA